MLVHGQRIRVADSVLVGVLVLVRAAAHSGACMELRFLDCAYLCKKICIMLQLQHLFPQKAFILLYEDNK